MNLVLGHKLKFLLCDWRRLPARMGLYGSHYKEAFLCRWSLDILGFG